MTVRQGNSRSRRAAIIVIERNDYFRFCFCCIIIRYGIRISCPLDSQGNILTRHSEGVSKVRRYLCCSFKPTVKGITCICGSRKRDAIPFGCLYVVFLRKCTCVSVIGVYSKSITYPIRYNGYIGGFLPFAAFIRNAIKFPTVECVSVTNGCGYSVILVISNRFGSRINRTAVRIKSKRVGISLPICFIASVTNATFFNGHKLSKRIEICSCPADKGIPCLDGVNERKTLILNSVFYGIIAFDCAVFEIILDSILFFAPYGIEFYFKSAIDLISVFFKYPFDKTITFSSGCLETAKISRRIIDVFYNFGNACGSSCCKRSYISGCGCA